MTNKIDAVKINSYSEKINYKIQDDLLLEK